MSKPREGPGGPVRQRSRAAAIALAVVPLLVSTGVLAPGVIAQLATGTPAGELPPQPFPEQMSAFDRRPMPLPRRLSLGFGPALLELQDMFLGAGSPAGEPAADLSPRQLAQLLSFPRGDGDSIILADTTPHFEEIVFKDALVGEPPVALVSPDVQDGFLPNCGALHATNCLRFDDFTGAGNGKLTVVPEPGTAGLLALGLLSLAALRRAG